MSRDNKATGDFAIGIDLGSSKMSVGVLRNGCVEVIPDEGENAIPSCVAFNNRTLLVGQAARRQAISNPKNTIVDPIRLLNWSLNDLDLQWQVSQLPFDIVSTPNERLIKVRHRNLDICLRPLEVSPLGALSHRRIFSTCASHLNALIFLGQVLFGLYKRGMLTLLFSDRGGDAGSRKKNRRDLSSRKSVWRSYSFIFWVKSLPARIGQGGCFCGKPPALDRAK